MRLKSARRGCWWGGEVKEGQFLAVFMASRLGRR